MDIYHQILANYWGYTSFRPLQEDIIHSICAGKDTLGLMPTGGGKSITFQVPAMTMEGVCIVVTPLIALMKDQVENLQKVGIKATAVYSGMSRQEIITQLENCIFGNYKFLYVSPERLTTDIFLAKLQAMSVCLLVIDESHCISQWGYDFRPSYLKIAEIRKELPNVPVLALTATATPDVVNDIQDKLGFHEKNVFQKSFARKNLAYIVRKTDDKLQSLIYILGKVQGSAIVYVRNRKRTKEIANLLQQAGMSADFFHAGLQREEKEKKQTLWKNNNCRIIVSTNAFGMGIDKPDVRLVIHIDMPSSLEEYYQEAGRAGRDGEKAYAVALCSTKDSAKLKTNLANEFPDKSFIYRVYDTLCNYFQIAMGFGLDTVHDFKLTDFCPIYKLPILQTHYALKILELSGYIEYTDEMENASRLIFLATREELYKYLGENKHTNDIVQVILRLYTGLFADYTYINENEIAARARVSQQDVYEALVKLSKYHIINYIPQKKTPLIIFIRPREETRYLFIPKTAYEDRKERLKNRIEKVLEYINNDTICRSQKLLAYFDEKESEPCHCCDVCQSSYISNVKNWEFETIRNNLLTQTNEQRLRLCDLVNKLPFSQTKISTVITFLTQHDNRFSIEDGRLIIRNISRNNNKTDN